MRMRSQLCRFICRLAAGRFDVTRCQPLARGGYKDYSVVREVFEMARPD